MAKQASINGVYCDDIRQEIASKMSLMGVYGAEMIFPTFPVAVSKLCVHVNLRFPFGKQPKKELRVEVLKGEEQLGQLLLNEQMLQEMKTPTPDSDIPAEDQSLAMQFAFALTPLQFEAPCRIRLLAYADGKEIKGNGLKVRLATPAERAANGWPPADMPSESKTT